MSGVVNFLQDIVRIPSVNGTHDESAVAHRIEAEARRLNIDCASFASPKAPTRVNVVASVGTGPPLFLFVAHADTVAEGIVEHWLHPPLSAAIAEGKMYGRGTADNKAGIAAALYALQHLKQNGILKDGKGKVMLAAVADEESGACSEHGLAYLLKENIVGGTGAIYCHIGSRVTIGHRGLIRLVITIHGQAVHSGVHEWCTGEKGSSASMALCEALLKLEQHDWDLALHEAFPKLRFTITPGTIMKGGEWESMVPPKAEALVDIRTMPEQNQQIILEKVKNIVDSVIKSRNEQIVRSRPQTAEPNPKQFLSYDITIKNMLPSAHIPPSHPLALACVDAVKQLLGEDVAREGCGPANEGYMLIQAGIPTICGFGYKGGNPHAPNEWVSVDSLEETVKVYAHVVEKYCNL